MIRKISEDVLWGQIVARAWCDEAFMKRLRASPRDVLVENGMEVPEGTEVELAEGEEAAVAGGTEAVRLFTLPAGPPDELTDEDLVVAPLAQCFCAVCAACAICGRCACRCACRCRCF
jgi:hypothetical protein